MIVQGILHFSSILFPFTHNFDINFLESQKNREYEYLSAIDTAEATIVIHM